MLNNKKCLDISLFVKIVRTAKIKLDISVSDVMPTITAYTKAYNYACQVGFDNKIKHADTLHKLTYYNIRERFNLKAQFAVTIQRKAAGALKITFDGKNKYPKFPISKQQSITYDKNSYTLNFKKKQVSFLLIDCRKKLTLNVPKYYQEYFDSWKHTSATLCIKKDKVYLHIQFEKEVQEATLTRKRLGIDRGINNIAVTSDNKFYGGSKVKVVVNKRNKQRKKLQKKGTKSAKRHLIRVSGKEKRFRADTNHKISKNIIKSLNPGDTIVLEDLKGIRNAKGNKKHRTLLNNWSFYQLEQFIIYKAQAKGIHIQHVDPAYTSQTCSVCGCVDKKSRKGSSFKCVTCGYRLNADLNGSRNIAVKIPLIYKKKGKAAVNQPNGDTKNISNVGAEKLLTNHQLSTNDNLSIFKSL